jgi:translation elongation factor EF-Ts
VMVEVNCETDFTGKTDEFSAFAKDVAMHIAAANPICISSPMKLPADVLDREREIFTRPRPWSRASPTRSLTRSWKARWPRNSIQKSCLLKQAFVKDTDKTIEDLLNDMRAKTGENVQIRRFVQLGETRSLRSFLIKKRPHEPQGGYSRVLLKVSGEALMGNRLWHLPRCFDYVAELELAGPRPGQWA